MHNNFVLRKEYKCISVNPENPFNFVIIPLARTTGSSYVQLEFMVIERDKEDIIHSISYDTRCVSYNKDHDEIIYTINYKTTANDMMKYEPVVIPLYDEIPYAA